MPNGIWYIGAQTNSQPEKPVKIVFNGIQGSHSLATIHHSTDQIMKQNGLNYYSNNLTSEHYSCEKRFYDSCPDDWESLEFGKFKLTLKVS